METFHWEEWERMVVAAHIDLDGTCPLLCDETIILLDELLRQHKIKPDGLD